jgi:hypothetical protein
MLVTPNILIVGWLERYLSLEKVMVVLFNNISDSIDLLSFFGFRIPTLDRGVLLVIEAFYVLSDGLNGCVSHS